VQALAPQRRIATASVGEVRIPAIDHDVARLHQRGQLVDHRVRRPAGLHHDDHGTGRSSDATKSGNDSLGTK
jgi:hypothetical protein